MLFVLIQVSNLIPEVAPEPTSVPLKDTTKQQYSAPQPASDPKDTDEQSTCVSNAISSVSSGVQDAGTKLGPSATRRKRFSTVPNLGQPRLRPSGQRSEAPSARASTEMTNHREQKENEQAVMRPPPVQRVLSVPTTNKKGGFKTFSPYGSHPLDYHIVLSVNSLCQCMCDKVQL